MDVMTEARANAPLNRRIVLAARPVGAPKASDFRLEEVEVPRPGPGQVLIKTYWLSLDPYMRGRMNDGPSYANAVPLGGVMVGRVVGEAVASDNPAWKVGEHVFAESVGWQEWGLSDGADLRRLDASVAPLSTNLSVLGMPGLTAYAGTIDLGLPKAGETLVVSAATGAVGSLVGQIARIMGLRAVGIAGGPEKCRWAVEELGFDACLDHREPDLAGRLKAACPKGVDILFENVGGAPFDATYPLLNTFARIVVCGWVSRYNATGPASGPDRLPEFAVDAIMRRLTLRGFIVGDHKARFADFHADVARWIAEGKVKWREDIADGLENAVAAFQGLLEGRNFGKQLVRVAPDPTRR
jgi:NADPH-dependent curcumin reductase CurA